MFTSSTWLGVKKDSTHHTYQYAVRMRKRQNLMIFFLRRFHCGRFFSAESLQCGNFSVRNLQCGTFSVRILQCGVFSAELSLRRFCAEIALLGFHRNGSLCSIWTCDHNINPPNCLHHRKYSITFKINKVTVM